MSELKLDLEKQSLQLRMAEFKSDSEKMQDVNDFLHDLFEKAQKEAQIRNGKSKGKLDSLGIQNGSKRIGAWSNRARTQARTFANRIFTTICNCTNSGKSHDEVSQIEEYSNM